jgi:hypothetical protein
MTASLIHQMYIAYYQRPADPAGLAYWQAQLTANGGGEAGWNIVAAAFANAAESSALYGSQTLSQKISAIYLAAFERAAVTSEVTFWENSGFTEAQIAFAIVNGAQNDDLSTVQNKEAYAVNFVAALDPAGTGVGPFEYEYSDPSIGRTLMGDVTSSSDVTAATVATQVAANVPTLVTVSLTSGADTITPTTNAVENITAALGGSSPSLGRTDQIDGGSASDTMTISTDGNFLLGFSTGYIKNVETINFDTTVTSVTTKLINLTGVSGVTTYNIGASKAVVKLSEMADVGGTVNLSGQTTGTFEVGFASGAISATGSAMTIGVSNVGTTGDAVQLITQGVTDLTLSAAADSYVNLSNAANDYQTITVIGSSDLYISDVGANASALEASSFAGDLTITVDTDTNTELAAAGKTLTGGAGSDTLRLLGSGIVNASTSSIEELSFDGSSGETIVRATGMVGITTLSFSGQNANSAPSLSGLDATDRTINAILDDATPLQQLYSAGGNVTLNLNVDPSLVASMTQSDNDFTFKSTNTGSTTINIGSYVSAAGTLSLSNTTGVTVDVDSTSHFGNTIKADNATTISVTGGADIAATVSGAAATTISMNVGSGTIAVGSTAISTFSLTNSGSVQITSANQLSGATTITVDTQSEADFSNVGSTGLTTLQVSGSGTLASFSIGAHSGVSTDLTISLTGGLEGGFSAASITKISSDVTLAATDTSGKITFDTITAFDTTIATGTIQDFKATSIDVQSFTFDGAAATSSTNSANVSIGVITASAAVTISLGAGTGMVSVGGIMTTGAVTVDASNFEGSLILPRMTGSGVTVSMGANGYISSIGVDSSKAFTLDGSLAASSNISLGAVHASTNATLSLGSGTGSLGATNISAGGLLVVDGGKSGGSFDLMNLTASGVTVSLGTSGDFSSQSIEAQGGGFTLDGANAASASISVGSISSSAALTISLGSGSGAVQISGLQAQAAVTIDASQYGGTMDLNNFSASGISIVTGTRGDLSAAFVQSTNAFVLDAALSTSSEIAMNSMSVSAAITIGLGAGSGSFAVSAMNSTKTVTIDASNFGGTVDTTGVSGDGISVTVGSAGNFSASSILSTNTFTLDASGGASTEITATYLYASGNAAISLGSGSGNLSTVAVTALGTFTIDATNSKANIDLGVITASGAVSVVTGTNGDFSAATIIGNKGFTLDASRASSGSIVITTVSVQSTDSTISLGSGTGSMNITSFTTNADLTVDLSKYNGAVDMGTISASGLSVTIGGAGNFSAGAVGATKAFTLDGSSTASADVTLRALSAVDSIAITLAGSANMSSGAIDTVDTFTLTLTGASESVDIANISASGVTISGGLQGDFSAAAVNSKSTITYDGSGATTAQGLNMVDISASGAISITLGGGSGSYSSNNIDSTEKAFTFSATNYDGEVDLHSLSASGVTISLGSGADFSASAIMTGGAFTFNSTSTSGSGETINITHAEGSGVTINLAAASTVVLSASSIGAIGGDVYISGTNFNGSIQVASISGSGTTIVSGANFLMSATSVTLTDNFTFNGAALTSATVTFVGISASGNAAMSFGSMSGDLTIGKISSLSDIHLSAEGAAGLGMAIGNLSASAIQITLGEVSLAANNFSASVIDGQNFTLDASLFRDSLMLHHVSAGSAVTITAGDLTDDLRISSLVTEMFTLNGGDGSNFSAGIVSASITGSAWSITMAENGNGLDIDFLQYSANWTIKGTSGVDSVTASSIAAAGTTTTIDFDFREDSAVDELELHGSAGATYLIMRNFDSAEDKLAIASTASATLHIGNNITAAAAHISTVLGSTLTASDIVSAATALFTYNGDTYMIADNAEDGNGTFGNGDTVIRFVGVTDIVQADVTFSF